MAHVDRISHLPEAILLRILSKLTITKDVVATMVLSKQWECLWKSVPKLVFDDSCIRFSRFVDRSLILHEAPVETLQFKLTQKSLNDIGVWLAIAVKCRVPNMCIDIDCSSNKTPTMLTRSLYTTGSRMLASLKLKSVTLMDVSTTILPSFPTLKNLSLVSVKYPGDEFVRKFLSSCHVLEDLVVEQCLNDNVTIFTIKVSSLKSASLYKSPERSTEGEDRFVIDAPSLEFLGIFYGAVGFCVIEDMPKIAKADVVAAHSSTVTLSSITSAKHLSICLPNSKRIEELIPELAAHIQCLHPSVTGAEDSFIWQPLHSGVYSTKSGYNTAATQQTSPALSIVPSRLDWIKDVWSGKYSPKLKVFLWFILQNAFPLGENLQRRGMGSDVNCPRCQAPETALHLFIDCPFARQVWDNIPLKKAVHIAVEDDFKEDAYSVGTVFHRLVHLKICTCETAWLNLLMRLLNDSLNLRYLKLKKCHKFDSTRPCWNDPSSAPECLSSSLETFEWVGYEGRKEEKEVAAFILRNQRCLKKLTISSESTDSDKKLEMLKELSLSFRISPTCQLAFT